MTARSAIQYVARPVGAVHLSRVGCSYFCDSVSVKPPERGVPEVVPPSVTQGLLAQLLRARDLAPETTRSRR